MKHCPRCGGKTNQESQVKYVCTVCGVDSYANPKAAAATFIIDAQGRFCFGIRAIEPHKGAHDCIGGFADWGEDLETAALREMREEAGITENDIESLIYLGSFFEEYEWKGDVEPVTGAYFLARLKQEVKFIADDDVSEIVALTPAEVDQSKFAWRGIKKLYPKALSFLQAQS